MGSEPGLSTIRSPYAYVPDMIRFYLGADPILEQVPTYLCWKDQDRDFVLDNLSDLVVKSANESGGYGMLVGNASTKKEREDFAQMIKSSPQGLHRTANNLSFEASHLLRGWHRGAGTSIYDPLFFTERILKSFPVVLLELP